MVIRAAQRAKQNGAWSTLGVCQQFMFLYHDQHQTFEYGFAQSILGQTQPPKFLFVLLDAFVRQCTNEISLHPRTECGVTEQIKHRALHLTAPQTSSTPGNVLSDCLGRRNKMLAQYPGSQHLTQAVWGPRIVKG